MTAPFTTRVAIGFANTFSHSRNARFEMMRMVSIHLNAMPCGEPPLKLYPHPSAPLEFDVPSYRTNAGQNRLIDRESDRQIVAQPARMVDVEQHSDGQVSG